MLVVDDDENALVLMRMALGRRGAEVTTAASAAEALDALEVVKPDGVNDSQRPRLQAETTSSRHCRPHDRL